MANPELGARRAAKDRVAPRATGDDMAPAYYLMATSVIGAAAIYFLRESARRPLPGSMPSVDTEEEAHELVASQQAWR